MDDEDLEGQVKQIVTTEIEQRTKAFVDDIVEHTGDRLKPMRDHATGYKQRFEQRWGRALDLFEACREVALMTGNEINEGHRSQPPASVDLQFDVVLRLHARVCLVAYEIETLLRSGFASGALARWRSMHEVGVVLQFISHHPTSAELYMAHEHIDAKKAAEGYNKVFGGTEREIPEADMTTFRKNAEDLVHKHGAAFKNDYGWASVVLNVSNARFNDLERETGLDRLRPDYKMASHAVHANVKGIVFDLGTSLSAPRTVMLSGPSNAGIADPACRALNTLALATATLATLKPGLPAVVHSASTLRLSVKASREFMSAHCDLVEDYKAVKRGRPSRFD